MDDEIFLNLSNDFESLLNRFSYIETVLGVTDVDVELEQSSDDIV